MRWPHFVLSLGTLFSSGIAWSSLCSADLEGQASHKTRTAPQGETRAHILREAGVDFLLMKLSPKVFADMVAQSAADHRISIPAARGIDPNTLTGVDHRLTPLFNSDKGKHAHFLIRNGSDSLSGGERRIPPTQWRIGLLFPVEILNSAHFGVVSSFTPENLRKGVEPVPLDAMTLQQFGEILLAVENANSVGSAHRTRKVQLHFESSGNDQVKLGSAAAVWVPAPLLDIMVAGRGPFLGQAHPFLPERGKAFQTHIATRDPSGPGGWKRLPPEVTPEMNLLDPQRRIGAWFHQIPDWRVIANTLATRGEDQGVDLSIFKDAARAPEGLLEVRSR